MYHWYFSLEKNPFKGSPDNGVVWSGKRRAKVLADLKQGIEADCRFMLLTGGPGTGKTTLVRNLVHTLPKAMRCAHIADPGRERHDLFLSIARDLGFDGPCRKSKKFASWLFSCLQHPDRQGQRAVIVVDQAQCMPGRFLSELVSCARSMPDQCLTILLVGRPGLHGVMEKTLGAGWRDMMDVHAVLNPLTQTETEEFINHLLVLAGAQYEIFNPPAIRQAFIYSKGSLRRLSRACDQAMITAYSKDMNRIDGPVFQEAVGKPAPKEDIEPFSASLPEKEAATRQSRVKRPARWVGSLAAALALAVLSCCFVFDPDLGLDKILGRAVSGLSENTGFKPVSFAVTSGDAKSSPGPDAVTMPAVVRAGVTQSVPPGKPFGLLTQRRPDVPERLGLCRHRLPQKRSLAKLWGTWNPPLKMSSSRCCFLLLNLMIYRRIMSRHLNLLPNVQPRQTQPPGKNRLKNTRVPRPCLTMQGVTCPAPITCPVMMPPLTGSFKQKVFKCAFR